MTPPVVLRHLELTRRVWRNAYVLLTLTAVFWAGNAIIARGARELAPPVALSFWRWSLALLIVLPFAWRPLARDLPVLRRRWPTVLLLGALGVGAFNTLLYTGLQSTMALNAMLLQSGQPALILLMGALLMRDRTSGRQVAGAAVSIAGVLAIVGRGDWTILQHFRFNKGDLVIGGAVVLWAVYSVLLRRRPTVHPLSFFAATLIVGVVAIAPFYVWELAEGRRIVASADSWLAIAYVGVFPSVLAYLFFNRGVELIGSAATGLYMNVMPVIGAGLATVFLGEALRLYHFVGMALIVGGIALAGRGPRPTVIASGSEKPLHRQLADERHGGP